MVYKYKYTLFGLFGLVIIRRSGYHYYYHFFDSYSNWVGYKKKARIFLAQTVIPSFNLTRIIKACDSANRFNQHWGRSIKISVKDHRNRPSLREKKKSQTKRNTSTNCYKLQAFFVFLRQLPHAHTDTLSNVNHTFDIRYSILVVVKLAYIYLNCH